MKQKSNWFEVDRAGLAQVIANRPKSFILFELIQNALDENTREIQVSIGAADRRGYHWITVSDDSPDGYQDITHAWTLFAPSKKKGDPEKRGRFNSGCKMVLALAESASVISTKSAVCFSLERGRELFGARTKAGTIFRGLFRLTKAEALEMAEQAQRLLLPPGVSVEITHAGSVERIAVSEPIHKLTLTLPTVFSDDEGNLRATSRVSQVELHPARVGERPTLYELGIPVVEFDGDDPFHVNVLQRVPLNADRDNVTPAYLRTLRVAIFNNVHDNLTAEQATATWATEASEDGRAHARAVDAVLTQRFGERRVAYDPNDREANARAVAAGYTLVHGGALTKGQWANAREAGVMPTSGSVFPTARVIESADGAPPIHESDWTGEMRGMASWAQELARAVGVSRPTVRWFDAVGLGFSGAWKTGAPPVLFLNRASLSHEIAAWKQGDRRPLLALLIHEFAHDKASNHLSDEFHNECCRLGAALAFIDFSGRRWGL